MNFFRRLYLKFRKSESPPSQRAAEIVYPITEPAPAPSVMTPVELDYLKRYPDVAKHEYFGSHPYQHYVQHGKAEGRTWGLAVPETPVPAPAPAPAPQPETPVMKSESSVPFIFTFGKVQWDELGFANRMDYTQRAAKNFDFIMTEGGADPAFDYLLNFVLGGASMFRQVWDYRGLSREESARIINKHGSYGTKGWMDVNTNEYVFGGNPFTKQGGTRYLLPFVVPRGGDPK